MKKERSHSLRLRTATTLGLVALLSAGALWAVAQGRMQALVTDTEGKPLQGVRITISASEIDFTETRETDKKGKVTFLVMDATRTFIVHLEKEGYDPLESEVSLQAGATRRTEWVMAPVSVQMEGQEVVGSPEAIALFNEAAQAYNDGDSATAIAKFEEALAAQPDMHEAYSALARVHTYEGDFEKAAQAAEKLLELQPDDITALVMLFDAYNESGQLEKADAMLARLIEVDPGTETAKRIFNRGVTAMQQDDRDAAIGYFERAMEVDPSLPQSYSALANIYLSKGEYDRALEKANKLLELDPGNLEAITVRYEAYRALGENEKAAEAFAALQNVDPEMATEAFYKQGVALFNAGNIADAKASFERTLAADGSHARAHYMLGLCHLNEGEMGRAKELLQQFLEMAPDDPEAPLAREMLSSMP